MEGVRPVGEMGFNCVVEDGPVPSENVIAFCVEASDVADDSLSLFAGTVSGVYTVACSITGIPEVQPLVPDEA